MKRLFRVSKPAKWETIKKNGDLQDIIDSLIESHNDKRWNAQTAGFSRQFRPTKQGIKELVKQLNERVTYKEDKEGIQLIQSPGHLWHNTKIGDCKSLTVFLDSVAKNLSIPRMTRLVGYEGETRVSHVYNYMLLEREWLPVDAVWVNPKLSHGGKLFTEKSYSLKLDYIPRDSVPALKRLGII